MRETGDMYFPWFDFFPGPIDIPYKLSLSSEGVGAFPAFLAGMAMSIILGIAVQVLIFGPFEISHQFQKL